MSHPNSPSPWGAPGQGQQPGGQHPGQPGGQPGGPQPGVPQPGGPQYPGTEQPGGQHPGQPNLGQQMPGQVQQGSGSPWGASGSGPQHGGAWQAQGSAPQQPGYGSAPAHPGQQNQVPGGQGQFNQGPGGQPGYGSAPGQPSYGSAPQQPGYGSAPQPVGGFGGANAGMPMPENVGKKAKKPKQPKAPGAGLIGPLTLRDILLLVAGLFALVALATPGYVVRVQGVSTGAEWFVQRWAASTIGYVVLGVLPILIAAVLTLVNKLTGSIRLIGSLSADQLISVLCAVALAMNVVWLVTMVMQFHVGAVFGVLASIIGFLAGTLTVIPAFGKEFAHRPAVDAHPKARPYTKSGAAPAAQGAPGQRAQGPVVENHGGQGAQPAGGYGSQPGSQFASGQGGPGSQPGSQFAPGQGGPGSQPGSQFAPGQGGPGSQPGALAGPGSQPGPQSGTAAGSQPGSKFAPGRVSVPGGHELPSQPSAQDQPWATPSGQSMTAGGSAAHGTGAPQNEQHGQGQHDHGQHGEAQKSEDTFHTSDDQQTYLGRHSAQEPRYAQNQPTQAFVTGGKENQASEQPGGPWAQGASAAGSAAGEPQNAGTSQKADGPKKSDEPQKAESAQEPNWAQGAGDVNGSGQTTSAAEPNQADESRGNSGAGATGVAAGVAGAGVAAGPAGATSANAGGTTGTGAAQSQNPWAKPDAVTDAGSESTVKDTSEAGSSAQGDSPREPDARGDAEAGVVDDNEPTQYFRPYEYSEQGFEPVNEGANGAAGEQVASADQETQLSQAVQPQQEVEEQAQQESSEAFWFAVPDPRPAVDETSGETVFMVTPGEWFLAVQNRGTSFVVHNSEQEEGVLHNVSDVILP